MSVMISTEEILERAVKEKNTSVPDTEARNKALFSMADSLLAMKDFILKANEEDVRNAAGRISDVMVDRLRLNKKRLEDMAQGLKDTAVLSDPLNRVLSDYTAPNGIHLQKVSVPFGVIAVIYESRPNVTSDAAGLIIKSGSTAVLRSGKDAWNSAAAIVIALRKGLVNAGLHADRIQLIQDTSHDSADALMKARGKVDLLIPRGGKNLIRRVVESATVPVIETGTGICHVYVDASADQDMALDIIENAKCSRPSVCNAEEVLLVHESIKNDFLPKLYRRLVDDRKAMHLTPVELRLDENVYGIIPGLHANNLDFDTEFLDYILAVKAVSSVEEAIAHINKHSTHHSESIITKDENNAELFLNHIDSACVYVNASTRFTDGGQFGLGCEMGISTQKLHARGPMGLEELCTTKYLIHGNGQVRK